MKSADVSLTISQTSPVTRPILHIRTNRWGQASILALPLLFNSLYRDITCAIPRELCVSQSIAFLQTKQELEEIIGTVDALDRFSHHTQSQKKLSI